MCQNNIDHAKFDESFREEFCLAFCCLDFMSECMMTDNITGNISKPPNKVLDIIKVDDEETSQDKN